MSQFLIQGQNFHFKYWSFLHKKGCEWWSVYMYFPENKNAKMVWRSKWSQSCVRRTEFFLDSLGLEPSISRGWKFSMIMFMCSQCLRVCWWHQGASPYNNRPLMYRDILISVFWITGVWQWRHTASHNRMTLDVPRYNIIMFFVFQGYDGDVREYHPQEGLSEPYRHQYRWWRPLMPLPLCRPDLWQHAGSQRCHPGLGGWDRGGQRAVGQRPYEGGSGPDDPGSEGESSHATIWGYWFPYIDWCLGIRGSFTSGLTICRCMQKHVQWLFDLYVLVSVLKKCQLGFWPN